LTPDVGGEIFHPANPPPPGVFGPSIIVPGGCEQLRESPLPALQRPAHRPQCLPASTGTYAGAALRASEFLSLGAAHPLPAPGETPRPRVPGSPFTMSLNRCLNPAAPELKWGRSILVYNLKVVAYQNICTCKTSKTVLVEICTRMFTVGHAGRETG